jgi:acetoin utilization deacetylase AcuC-like enzyme
MRCAYHPDYFVPLPGAHPFPMSKYPLLYERLLAEGVLSDADVLIPGEASLQDLALVHTADYLERLQAGSLDAAEIRRIGVPWSAALWRRSRLAVQGTIEASRAALSDGLAGNLAGGTHHAFADHGEGFCVLNDVAVAIRVLRREARIATALVVDLDVHQGNGTAAIFVGDPAVYTFSMHGERNYPARKMQSRVDVGLRDGVEDDEYLALLERHLATVLAEFAPDIVYYLAGVDPAQGDRYGRLKLSDDGILRRDRLVLDSCRDRGLPTVITMAGGYAATPARTAELHAIVFREAAKKAIIAGTHSTITAGSPSIRPATE